MHVSNNHRSETIGVLNYDIFSHKKVLTAFFEHTLSDESVAIIERLS